MTSKAVIQIDERWKCDRCGKGGATQYGICLKCYLKALKSGEVAARIKEEGMAKRRSDGEQPPLVPMSEDELRQAGGQLARKINELRLMNEDHATIRQEQKAERDKLRDEINRLAETIRTQGR